MAALRGHRFSTAGDPVVPVRPDWAGTRTWWYASGRHGSSRYGAACLTEFDPGSRHGLHAHPRCEQVALLLSGSGLHLTANGGVPQGSGTGAFIGRGEPHGFANTGSEPARLLVLFAGASGPEEAGFDDLEGESGLPHMQPDLFSLETRQSDLRTLKGQRAESSQFVALKVADLASDTTLGTTVDEGSEVGIFVLTGSVRSSDDTEREFVSGDGLWLRPGSEAKLQSIGTTRLLLASFGLKPELGSAFAISKL